MSDGVPMNKQEPEYLSGTVERITYHNEETGFAVLRVKVRGHKDLVTIIGTIPAILVGEYIKSQGVWQNNIKHGLQFKADFLKNLPPNNLHGIEKYLGSGLIRGIGSHFAKRLVKAFGEDVFDVIEKTPDKLTTIDGVGKVRAESICKNWQQQKVVREIMIFLQSHGVGTARATRIYKIYGDDAIKIVSQNPYKLAKDIRGIGFLSSDDIARNLGIEADSLIRAQAGVNHILFEATSDGHCGLPVTELLAKVIKLLDVGKPIIETAIAKELVLGDIVHEVINGQEMIFLASYHCYENNIYNLLKELQQGELPWGEIDIDRTMPWVEGHLRIKLADNQKEALKCALQNKITVITGGPGTGKTTLVNALLNILERKKINIKLCAPTGRAAKKLNETTAIEALTVHRLLAFDPKTFGFKHNDENPLKCDYLVIDETSMVDVPLFNNLIKALPKEAGLLLIGDVDQLPSVGAGAVLSDIIDSEAIATVKLTEVFRQAAASKIISNAHRVNKGYLPELEVDRTKESDFYFISIDEIEKIPAKLVHLVKDRIPKRFGFHPRDSIQILCPMQRGGTGARSLNIELQKALNPNSESGINKFGQNYAVSDKVMQTKNNYNKETYNGDMGIITKLNNEDQEAIIDFLW